jgi:nicotinamide-nucleotide amidase
MAPGGNVRIQVLTTGDELLSGRRVDDHLSWISRELESHGLEVIYHATVGDDFDRIVEELKLAAARADVCIMTGGLGPTEDDRTRPAVEEAFHRPLRFDPKVWKTIQNRFRKYGIPMAATNRRQAFRPEGAVSLPNPVGSAPGFRLRADGLLLFSLPGPPREMRAMFRKSVLSPLLRGRKEKWESWEAYAVGLPEGDLDELLKPIVGQRARYGLTVHRGIVTISLKSAGARRRQTLQALSGKIRKALGHHYLERSLEEEVGRLLLGRRKTIAVAESCTGGLIGHKLTDVPGISDAFLESFITYSNRSKERRLGVPAALLRKHGAVSPEVAAAMVEGVVRETGAAIGLATTGIAGPAGGTRKKPVGLVYTAVSNGGKVRVSRRIFPGDRREVKERASNFALNMVRRALMEKEGSRGRKEMGLRGNGPGSR